MSYKRNTIKVITAGKIDKKRRGKPRKSWLHPIKEDLWDLSLMVTDT